MSEIEIVRARDAEAAARDAAAYIAERVREGLGRRPRFCLAVSGGSTPRRMLEALAGAPLDWSRLHVLQVDERIAPAGDAARNLNMVEDTLLASGALPAPNLHPMPVEEADAETAARRYATTLEQLAGAPPVIDLVHLGLGDDGHTASLLPGDPALTVVDRAVTVSGEYRGHRRLTLTLPVLDRARCRLWLATGEAKRPMLARLIEGDASIPAGRVRREASVVFTDLAAS